MEKKDKEKKKNKNISDVKNILVSNVNQLMSNPQGVANLQSILDKNILFQRKVRYLCKILEKLIPKTLSYNL